MRKSLAQRLAALLSAGALALGAGIASAGPAAAEQPDKYVFTNTGADLGGYIATKSGHLTSGPETNWAPGAWAGFDEGSIHTPWYVMAGNGYCVREVVRRANSTNPSDRTWTAIAITRHGSTGPRQAYRMAWLNFIDNNAGSRSLESRVSVVSC